MKTKATLIDILYISFTLFISTSSRAQSTTEVTVQDTRHSITTPSSYSKNLQLHFKYHSSMAGLDGGMYFPVIGIRGWTEDNSGGKAHELTFSDDNQIYVRSGYSPSWEGWRRLLTENHSGNVGIGTKSPDQKLTIKGGGIGFDGNSADKKLYSPVDGVLEWMTHDLAGEHAFAVSHQGTKRVYLSALGNSYLMGGNVGIGTMSPQAKLSVNGDIFSKRIKVTQIGWPDYVFEPTYKLPTISEVEAYIKLHQHLPDVPSAKDIDTKGLDLGDNQAVLLKKIEEQMLYIIELNKQLQEQQKTIEYLKQRIEK